MSQFHQKDIFNYQVTKDKKILIYWNNQLVTTLANKRAEKFLRQIDESADPQYIMARFTGNFKRGNEREAKSKNSM